MMNQPYPPDPRTPGYAPGDETIQSTNINGAYSERQRQNYPGPAGSQVETQHEVYEDRSLRDAAWFSWLRTVVYFLFSVLEVILGLRFIFRLLGANEGSSFTLTLYQFSHVFVGPFNGIFNDQAIGSRSVFELSTLVAILIYALIGWGIVALIRVLFVPSYSGRRFSTTRRRQI